MIIVARPPGVAELFIAHSYLAAHGRLRGIEHDCPK